MSPIRRGADDLLSVRSYFTTAQTSYCLAQFYCQMGIDQRGIRVIYIDFG